MDSETALSTVASEFPPEILCNIFLECIPSLPTFRLGRNRPRAHFPWLLTHVCRDWRHSALAFQKLWAYLDLQQTDENEEPGSPAFNFLRTYLERSGQYPLTFFLTFSGEGIDMHPFMRILLEHSARWQDVHIEAPSELMLAELSRSDTSRSPILRRFACSSYDFLDPKDRVFDSIPLGQLERYHEYGHVSSWIQADRQWEIISQLTHAVALRTRFTETCEDVIQLPSLRFAFFAVDTPAARGPLLVEEILKCFDLPQLEGLSFQIPNNHPPNAFYPVPPRLKTLKILRLWGWLTISNEALACILTDIPTLTDFAIDLYENEIDAGHLFGLLRPHPKRVLLPRLRALRTTPFSSNGKAADNELLAMLRERFEGVAGVEFSRLRLFTLFPSDPQYPSSRLPIEAELQSLKAQEGWDIWVDNDCHRDFWDEDMDEAYL